MKHVFTLFFVAIAANCCFSQADIKPENYSVPTSPAFNLLDVTPTKVNKPGFAKDFKFDWFIKNNQLAPNIALEVQPIWLLFFRKTSYSEFTKKPYLMRMLSTLDFSLGTSDKSTTKAESIRGLAYAFKLNIYSEKDPIYEVEYIENSTPADEPEIERLEIEKIKLQDSIKRLPANSQQISAVEKRLVEIKKLIESYDTIVFEKIEKYRKKFQEENWNSDIVDIGFGQVFNYFGENLSDMKFESKGNAIWISGIKGIGRRVMLNGMVKYSKINDIPVRYVGGNVRYGSGRANVFAEFVRQWSNGGSNASTNTLSYGGDFKIANLFYIQFGLRTEYKSKMRFKGLLPIVNLNYIISK